MQLKRPPLSDDLLAAIHATAIRHGLQSLRVFGSYIHDPLTARDIDLIVISEPPTFAEYSHLVLDLESLFNKRVDLVVLDRVPPGELAVQIGATSVAIFETEAGRDGYAVKIDRLLALTEDQNLSFTAELKKKSLIDANRRLRGP